MEISYTGKIKFKEKEFEFIFEALNLCIFVDEEFIKNLSLREKEEGQDITSFKPNLPFSSLVGKSQKNAYVFFEYH